VREFLRQKATRTEDPTTKRPVMAAPCKENKMAAKKMPAQGENDKSVISLGNFSLHFQEFLKSRRE
jgi:hypothetical protein